MKNPSLDETSNANKDTPDWESTKHFNKNWLLWMRKYQPFMPETTIIRNAKWFEYVFNEDNPGQSTFRCRLCYRNYDAFKITKKYRPILADEKPVIVEIDDKKTRYLQNRINAHALQWSHNEVIKKLCEKNGLLPELLQEAQLHESANEKTENDNFINESMDANDDIDEKNDELFNQPMSESLDVMKKENPWDISSIYDLAYFNCPECDFQTQSKQEFIDHTSNNHPWVSYLLEKKNFHKL